VYGDYDRLMVWFSSTQTLSGWFTVGVLAARLRWTGFGTWPLIVVETDVDGLRKKYCTVQIDEIELPQGCFCLSSTEQI
jgi:hypothetical protein